MSSPSTPPGSCMDRLVLLDQSSLVSTRSLHPPNTTKPLTWQYRFRWCSEDRGCTDPNRLRTGSALFGRQGWTTLVVAPDIRLALDTEHRVTPCEQGVTRFDQYR